MSQRKFSKVKAVKENSRDRIGPVPATKIRPNKKKKLQRKFKEEDAIE